MLRVCLHLLMRKAVKNQHQNKLQIHDFILGAIFKKTKRISTINKTN